MAGWSTTDWESDSIQAYANEFWLALNERKALLGQTPFLVPAVGANIQSASATPPTSTTGTFGFRVLQDWITTYCDQFARSHNIDGSKRDSDYYDDSSDSTYLAFRWLLGDVRGDGVYPYDFRRATIWPDDWTDWDDAAYSDGKIQEGDIMGPWIFADLQAALNMLIWSLSDATWDSYYKESHEVADTPEAEKAASVAEFLACTPVPTLVSPSAESWWLSINDIWVASLNRTYSVPSHSITFPLPFDVRCELYLSGTQGNVFYNHGDDIKFQLKTMVETQNVPADQESVTFNQFGSDNAPAWYGSSYWYFGYSCRSSQFICFADVDGGFEYV
jgi:hypothetical protein